MTNAGAVGEVDMSSSMTLSELTSKHMPTEIGAAIANELHRQAEFWDDTKDVKPSDIPWQIHLIWQAATSSSPAYHDKLIAALADYRRVAHQIAITYRQFARDHRIETSLLNMLGQYDQKHADVLASGDIA